MEINPEIVANGAATIAGLKYLGKPTAQLLKELIGKTLFPAADAVGQILADPLVEYQRQRVERRNALLESGTKLVLEMGETPKPVPGRLLFPIMDYGSAEEDDELVGRWAALLANASVHQDKVLPAFASILSELSPMEARFLARVKQLRDSKAHYEQLSRDQHNIDRRKWQDYANRITDKLSFDHIWEGLQIGDPVVIEINLTRLSLLQANSSHAGLSPFGQAFMSACTPPGYKVTPFHEL